MKNIFLIFLIVFSFSCQQNETSVVEANSALDIESEKEQLRFLKEVEWPKAYRQQDTVLLDRILGDDFQMIDNSGLWSNKNDELEWIKNNGVSYDSFRYEIKRLEVFDNGTAIISGTGHIVNDSIQSIYQSSNILIKRDGVWKAITSHVSGYKTIEE